MLYISVVHFMNILPTLHRECTFYTWNKTYLHYMLHVCPNHILYICRIYFIGAKYTSYAYDIYPTYTPSR